MRRPLGQPQLRGPDQPGREGELSGQPAAGRRLRAGRADGPRPAHRAARARAPMASPSTCATSGRAPRRSRSWSAARSGRRCSPATTPRCSPGMRTGTRSRCPRASATPGRTPPTCAAPASSRGCRPILPASSRSRERGCWPLLGDSITTDHISPAGAIKKDSPAGRWLIEQGVEPRDFNSYGSRRGNHEVMVRGTFANIRLRNRLVQRAGGFTRHFPDGEETTDI